MKALLIHPVPPRDRFPRGIWRTTWVPTGLGSVAASLQAAGHDVRVHMREEQLRKRGFDWAAADAALRDELASFRPGLVGLSALTPAIPETAQIARMAKDVCGDVITVVGGAHPSALPERTLADCPAVDVVVVGEGERTVVELAAGGIGPEVAGIAYRENGAVRRTPPRPPEQDLDSLPPIDYGLFDMDYYTAPHRWLLRYIPTAATNIRTSRGCPHRCRFCAGHVVSGTGVRFRSPQHVAERVQTVVDRFGLQGIRFEDDTLGADPERLIELCDELRRRGLHERVRWEGCLRVDQAEPGLLAAMKSGGCLQVEYGFESGSDEELRRLGKNATVEQNRRAVRLTREAGMRIYANIMIGMPGETPHDVRETLRFLRWAAPEVISPSMLRPLPGTPIFNELPADVRESMDWARYEERQPWEFVVNLTAMSDEQLTRVARRFFRYFMRPWLWKQLLRDTPADDAAERARFSKPLRRFLRQHPIHYLRLPR